MKQLKRQYFSNEFIFNHFCLVCEITFSDFALEK